MSTLRTKTLFALSALPLIVIVGGAAGALIYLFYLNLARPSTFFLVFHIPGHWLRSLAVSAVFFLAGLISLHFDR